VLIESVSPALTGTTSVVLEHLTNASMLAVVITEQLKGVAIELIQTRTVISTGTIQKLQCEITHKFLSTPEEVIGAPIFVFAGSAPFRHHEARP
jgi:hypothetical protein